MMNSKKPESKTKHYMKNDKYKDAIVNVVKKKRFRKKLMFLLVEMEMSSKIKV